MKAIPIADRETGKLDIITGIGGQEYVKVYDPLLMGTRWQPWDPHQSADGDGMAFLVPKSVSQQAQEVATDVSSTGPLLPKLGNIATTPTDQAVADTTMAGMGVVAVDKSSSEGDSNLVQADATTAAKSTTSGAPQLSGAALVLIALIVTMATTVIGVIA